MIRRPFTAISFDLGQTLVELDPDFLAEQAASRGIVLEPTEVAPHLDVSWQAYNRAKAERLTGFDAWAPFMRTLLERLGSTRLTGGERLTDLERESFVRYLWSEQPARNLWRKPIAGIRELLEALKHAGRTVAVLTNSEGRAKELVEQVGFGAYVDVVVDSGLEGIEKPDPRIFYRLAERLGQSPEDIVHIGDSYEADVLGALGAGMRAVWFVERPAVTPPAAVQVCRSVRELRMLLLAS